MTTHSNSKSAPAKGMPRHIQDRLIADGVMTEQRVTRTTTQRRCATCHAWVITAIDDNECLAIADPDKLTDLGEAQALTTGKHTWANHANTLAWRDLEFITEKPARQLTIHAEHKCGTPIPDHHRPETITTIPTDEIPY